MKAYKLVSRSMESLIIVNPIAKVQYGVGKTIVPNKNCGPLTAFKKLAGIHLFKQRYGWRSARLFECRVEINKKAAELWYYSWGERVSSLLSTFPEGTILCKKITLIKERE